MINKEKLRQVIAEYKKFFLQYFVKQESFKWRAVQVFQDNWDIEADDFAAMFKRATSVAKDLLGSYASYPVARILVFADKDKEYTRSMFRNLFDESQDLATRIREFMSKAKVIQEQVATEKKQQDYQDTNAISTYLWLKYPEKYYIYKYTASLATAVLLEADYIPKTGAIDAPIECSRMLNEICEELKKDEELITLFHDNLPSNCYPDPEFHTLTWDVCFYIDKYYIDWIGKDFITGIGVEKWKELLQDKSVFYDSSMEIMKCMKEYGGEATCSQLAQRYGRDYGFYNLGSSQLGKRIAKKTGCPTGVGEASKYWPILYLGRYPSPEEKGVFSWKLRDELSEALESIDLSGVQLFETKGNADYIGILEYLDENREHQYNSQLETDNPEYKALRERGEEIVCELEKIAQYYAKNHNLDECEPISWLDGSGTKTARSLQIVLKKHRYKDCLISIKIVAEFNPERKSYYRVSLDIENDDAEDYERNQFHSFLDEKIENEKLFITGKRDEWGNPIILDEPIEEIRRKVQNGEYRKVQLSSFIYRDPRDNSITKLSDGIMEAVNSLLPYYERSAHTISKIKGGAVMEYDKNMILYGPPGTGKTYSTAIYAVAICDELALEAVKSWDYADVMERYNQLKESGRIVFTTFHQSYGYEEFIEGIKPVLSAVEEGTARDLQYTVEDGVFKAFCAAADNGEQEDGIKKPYVFIIDEINRGNISKVFGELITLIEESKRKGSAEELSVVLPYSKESFCVPGNVYLIGTMNTADRSIALMDTALRRRFRFVEDMPDITVLRKLHADFVEDLDVAEMLRVMNERIAILYDREHTIGHAYFIPLRDNPSIECLANIFRKAIVPLLQEYFYENYQDIQAVLGDNYKSDEKYKFILEDHATSKVFKGNFAPDNDVKYTINEDAFMHIESYKEIL